MAVASSRPSMAVTVTVSTPAQTPEGFGGHVTAAQANSTDVQDLADAARRELLVKTDLIAAAEGTIKLSACRDGDTFGRFLLNTSIPSERRRHRPTPAQIRRLGDDVYAKIMAQASKLDSSARTFTLVIRPQGAGYDIGTRVEYS